MDRCWLKGAEGDALHAVLCAAGFNIRWLLRAIVRLGLRAAFLRLLLRLELARTIAMLDITLGWLPSQALAPISAMARE